MGPTAGKTHHGATASAPVNISLLSTSCTWTVDRRAPPQQPAAATYRRHLLFEHCAGQIQQLPGAWHPAGASRGLARCLLIMFRAKSPTAAHRQHAGGPRGAWHHATARQLPPLRHHLREAPPTTPHAWPGPYPVASSLAAAARWCTGGKRQFKCVAGVSPNHSWTRKQTAVHAAPCCAWSTDNAALLSGRQRRPFASIQSAAPVKIPL
jgi:hypothetical protein